MDPYLKHTFSSLPARDYIRGYRDEQKFIGYCRECGNYGTVWACPPYAFDTLGRIRNYGYVNIIGTQVFVDETVRHAPRDADHQKVLSYEIMRGVRKILDSLLLGLENEHAGGLAFFAGSCMLCTREECTRNRDRKCIYPDRVRSSLEAYGFDISKTTSELLGIELKWSENLVLPEYFTLVSGLFSDREMDDRERRSFEVTASGKA